jgi:predicted amidohydrolase YtcJ
MKSQGVYNSGESPAMQDHRPLSPGPDLLVLGRIRTLDRTRPWVRALAVRGGRVVAAGEPAEARAALSPGHGLLDVGDRLVLPGFVDAHAHLVDGGLFLAALDLAGVGSRSEWDRRVSAYVADDDAEWITGGGWDHERWGGDLPDRSWLDVHSGVRPALLMRSDLHMALANSAALASAGIDVDGRTADPDGGQIVRDADGRATGVLRDTAIELVTARLPAPTDTELDAAVLRAVTHAHRYGVTQIHDMGELPPSWRDLQVLERLEERGDLDLRVSVATPATDWQALADRIREQGRGSDRLRWGSVKAFVDGSLGAGTARFHEPFDDLSHTRGLVVNDPERLRDDVEHAWAAGIQPIVHAIGDAAVDWLVDVYAGLGPGSEDVPPPRIEHAQHLGPDTAARMARTGAIASMQPSHLVADAPWLERRIGPDRATRAYAVRTLQDAGVPIAFGSDWTVAPLDPLVGIRAAVDRLAVDGRVFGGGERIPVERAVAAYTSGAAAAAGFRGVTGHLSVGAFADFVVLTGIDPEEIGAPETYQGLGEAHVVRTFVGGTQVYAEETDR